MANESPYHHTNWTSRLPGTVMPQEPSWTEKLSQELDLLQGDAHSTIGISIPLSGGISYNTATSGAGWAYTNLHGDTILTTGSSNNTTWTGYWGPYGETPSGQTSPADTALTGGTYGYNGAQGKLSSGNLVQMGARAYSLADGRFIQPDPIEGGCANDYTYAFGDPINHPDLGGQFSIGGFFHGIGCWVSHNWKTVVGVTMTVAGYALIDTPFGAPLLLGGLALQTYWAIQACSKGLTTACELDALALNVSVGGAWIVRAAGLGIAARLGVLGASLGVRAPTFAPKKC